jgi:hypothetical protein
MHIIFGKGHVSGASACCPGDVSSDEASGEDVKEVPKPAENAEKSGNQGKKKRKAVEDKDEKSPFFSYVQEHLFEDRNCSREDLHKC